MQTVSRGGVFRNPAGQTKLVSVSKTLNRKEITMHDLIIASSLVAMLVVPCFAAMKADVATEELE
jgi:hypothetical protein